MAKEKPEDPAERAARKAEKKARKEAKEAAAAAGKPNGSSVHKSSSSKKDRKSREEIVSAEAADQQATTALLNTLEADKPGSVVVKRTKPRPTEDDDEDDEGDADIDVKIKPANGRPVIRGALVPFAHPLAQDKTCRKVLKGVRRANTHLALKRGVKEVVKHLRKSSTSSSSSSSSSSTNTSSLSVPPYLCVLAADISPMDVISHLPVLCEDQRVPYIFVPSRADLGAAGATKRPTSVVLVGREARTRRKAKAGKSVDSDDKMDIDDEKKSKKHEEDDGEKWEDTYAELVKVVEKAGKSVMI